MTKINIEFIGPIIKYVDAKRLKSKFFFTAKPCKRGHIDKRRVDNYTCISCIKHINMINYDKKIQWVHKNPEKRRESRRKWDLKNREYKLEYARNYRKNNKERKAAENKKWWSENRDKGRVYSHNRRAKIKEVGGTYSESDILAIKDRQKMRCAEPTCLKKLKNNYHIDHIMPIVLGGSNYPHNLQILCRSCNLRKSGKHPIDWAKQNGRLL